MMKKTLSFFFLLLFSISFIQAQSLGVTLKRIGCTRDARVDLGIYAQLVASPLFVGTLRFVECNGLNDVRELISHEIGSVRYDLQEQSGSTWTTIKSEWGTSSSFVFKNINFIQGSNYRVEAHILTVKSTRGTEIFNACFLSLPVHDGNSLVYFSSILEFIDSPVPDVTLLDVFGSPFNDVFCDGDPVYMDAADSFGETSYLINMSMHEPNQGAEIGWTDCGAYTGQIGDGINVLDLWQLNHPTWDLWPGYSYRIHIVYQNSCNVWLNFFQWFDVVPSGCRTADIDPEKISIFPNPATNEIRFMNLEGQSDDYIPYLIADMSGRIIKQGNLSNPNLPIDVSELGSGMYLVRLSLEDGMVTEKFSVVR